MNRYVITTALLSSIVSSLSGCNFLTNLTGSLGGGRIDGAAFAVDMEKYDVESIALRVDGHDATMCPGESANFTVVAQAKKKKSGERVELQTAAAWASAAEVRGKMDLTEFAMSGKGGVPDRGAFRPDPSPFTALLGYDLRATYRTDTTKTVTRHFDPVYSCVQQIGLRGATGPAGQGGAHADDPGGSGGAGGPGGMGAPGPRLVAHVTVVRTPKHERVGMVKISGDLEAATLFDLATGITITAAGGTGGTGGSGGDGAQGSDPQGAGGGGGPGGSGGPGGPGGELVVFLDDRFPELERAVHVDVGGGAPGYGGNGGNGGPGGPAPERACDECEDPPPGADGPGGPAGPDGTMAGAPGRYDVRTGDLDGVFASMPKGVQMRSEPHPRPVAPPTPSRGPGKKPKRR